MNRTSDQPPERNSLRRIQTGAAMSLACAALALWAAGGEQVNSLFVTQANPIASPTGIVGPILGVVGVMLLSMLFAAGEAAVELLRPVHVKHIREKNPKRGDRLQALLDRRMKYVATCRLGIYSCVLLLVGLAFLMAPHLVQANSFGYILLVALILTIPIGVVNLMLELVAKSYASLHPHAVANAMYAFCRGSSLVFWLPEQIVTGVAGLVAARFGGRATFAISNQTEEEIKTLVESGEESGEIEMEERNLLHSVFEFTDTVAREVMTPRVDLDAMPVTSAPIEVAEVIKESGHSRIPLYEETDDQIVGIVHAKDLYMALLNGHEPNLRELMRQPLFVPENKDLHELLSEMRAARSQMAVVQDEFGGTAGIVTIEDIVEELVGDIVDEYDEEEPAVVEEETGWSIEGKTHLDDVNSAIGSHLVSEEFDTVGGYVFGLFGRQPEPEEHIESDGYVFRVTETDGRRIARLHICEVELDAPDPVEEQV